MTVNANTQASSINVSWAVAELRDNFPWFVAYEGRYSSKGMYFLIDSFTNIRSMFLKVPLKKYIHSLEYLLTSVTSKGKKLP